MLGLIPGLACLVGLGIYYLFKFYKRKRDEKALDVNIFEENKFEWIDDSEMTILIPKYNIEEDFIFDSSFSDYDNITDWLEEKGLNDNRVDDVIEAINYSESIFQNEWNRLEETFNEVLDSTPEPEEDPDEPEYAISTKYQILFLDELRKNTIKFFIFETIPYIIKQALNLNSNFFENNDQIDKLLDKTIENFVASMEESLKKHISDFLTEVESEPKNSYYNNSDSLINDLEKAYWILGLTSDVNDEELKKVYLQLSKIYHPDAAGTKNTEFKMTEINNAYNLIKKNKNIK
ncbi:J domain-containing protein [Williamsoniiplasma lucivorax]|uniref:J domain-containing protein n=1 Tax=Williamsoniiplasma lucivorax TaxID=209274 RepID=A0A2S5REN5_9MOLU|nr:DnaJ domain-containing protein [Williamsoniiplasma lucivorax]PPE05786.1 hypothetical protein ELUCI_v1c00740 [Williamsoniiplasma lucivorax]